MALGAMFGGVADATVPANNSSVIQHQAALIPGSSVIQRKRKRTPLGTAFPIKGKHQFKQIPQRHKKHTNLLKCSAKAKRKRARKRKAK